MNIRLDGRRALVTGGNSGIGEAVAHALVEAGAKVAINYLVDPEKALQMAAQFTAAGCQSLALHGDVSNPASVEAMFRELDQSWGGLDVLINNAGVNGERKMAWESDREQWRRVLEINLFGAYYCAREALKRMIPQKSGVVLSVSSVHEVIPWSGYSAYAASKAGLGMLTRTMAQEAAPFGVRVLAIGPGAIQTSINREVWTNPETRQDLLDKIPLKRLGLPEEIGQMVVLLVSDPASYLTGRTVFVDGGMTTYPSFAHGG